MYVWCLLSTEDASRAAPRPSLPHTPHDSEQKKLGGLKELNGVQTPMGCGDASCDLLMPITCKKACGWLRLQVCCRGSAAVCLSRCSKLCKYQKIYRHKQRGAEERR